MKEQFQMLIWMLAVFFISHMVQMKASDYIDKNELSRLYIPHGSDESKSSNFPRKSSSFFISHMVQMKEKINHLTFKRWDTLYPTWFRWKLQYLRRRNIQYILYIPHGSDESVPFPVFQRPFPAFISHMVQMKVLSPERTISYHLPLYPTWFRWKDED